MEKVNYKFEQLRNASARLDEALARWHEEPGDLVVQDSVIQRFEFTTELFWKFLKILLESKGHEVVASPLEVIRVAKTAGILEASDKWAELIHDRNLTSHTYDDEQATEIFNKIKDEYAAMFRDFIENYARAS
jgi:nucleotidyltransferase substrate binding protein (TIGR01987 family)